MTTAPAQSGLDIETLRLKSQESLYFFAKGVLGFKDLNEKIHGPLCEQLQNPDNRFMLVELPRTWFKSTIATIAFPIWLSINDPDIRILVTQNTYANACKKLSVIGQQWEKNGLLRALFPELLPDRNSRWSADGKCLKRSASHPEATYEAAGANTAVISRHYDVIIEDDTVAPQLDELGDEALAPTQEEVKKAIGWHKLILPLFVDLNKGRSLVIGTRWYDQDLIRYVKDNEPQYKVFTRAAREDAEGKPDPKGEITYPERFNEENLKALEQAMGPYMFTCLYLNMPVRADDMPFKSEWFKLYERPPEVQNLAVYTTVDVAKDPGLAKGKNNDYNVVMTTAKDMATGLIYVLDYFRARCNPGELAAAIFDHVIRFRPISVGYEDVAYQSSVEYWLKELMKQKNVYFILVPVKRHGKDAKSKAIYGLQPLFAAGAILLREYHKELISELIKFPLGDHDDVADALSMQLGLWRTTRTYRQVSYQNQTGDFTFESAVASIRTRAQRGSSVSLVFDPSRSLSTLEN